MHAVVGILVFIPRKQNGFKKENRSTVSDEDAEDVDARFEQKDEHVNDTSESPFTTDDASVRKVLHLIQKLLCFCFFAKNPTMSNDKIEFLQKQLNGSNNAIKVKLDLRTRRNSTLEMLLRII